MKLPPTIKGPIIVANDIRDLCHAMQQRYEVVVTDSSGVAHIGIINKIEVESGSKPVNSWNIYMMDNDVFHFRSTSN